MGTFVPTLASSLGTVGSLVGTASQLVNTVDSLTGRSAAEKLEKEQDLALRQLQAQQELKQQQDAAAADLDRQRLAAEALGDEEERRAALRRAVARQRAQFGASGIGNAGGGSSEAVLLGLFDETQDDLERRARIDNLRNQAIDLSLANTKSLNVLQRSQLQERQRFERAIQNDRSGFLF